VRVLPCWVVPEMVGGEELFGAAPVGWTIPVGREIATPEPLAFVAVTCTRRRWPTSVVTMVYWSLVAPAIAAQLPAWSSQRFHWYA